MPTGAPSVWYFSGSVPHLPILKLTRESSADDDVVVLWVTIKNEVLIGRVLERRSYLCPLRTGGVGPTGWGRKELAWDSFPRGLHGAEVGPCRPIPSRHAGSY